MDKSEMELSVLANHTLRQNWFLRLRLWQPGQTVSGSRLTGFTTPTQHKNTDIAFDINDITAEQYYDYVYHVVERYDGDGINDMPWLKRPVIYFELGNEEDYKREVFGVNQGYMSPEDYVCKRLIPGYKAAKAANANCIVMCAGLGMESNVAGDHVGRFNTDYLEAMYSVIKQNDGSAYNHFMDKIDIHYYSEYQNPEKVE